MLMWEFPFIPLKHGFHEEHVQYGFSQRNDVSSPQQKYQINCTNIRQIVVHTKNNCVKSPLITC